MDEQLHPFYQVSMMVILPSIVNGLTPGHHYDAADQNFKVFPQKGSPKHSVSGGSIGSIEVLTLRSVT